MLQLRPGIAKKIFFGKNKDASSSGLELTSETGYKVQGSTKYFGDICKQILGLSIL